MTKPGAGDLAVLAAEISACRHCAPVLPADVTGGPRPVVRLSASAKLCIAGQAPGARVHASGLPFDDPSGDRLRDWLGLNRDQFYDQSKLAIVPMGFCFPGTNPKGGDYPPRPECAPLWRERVFAAMPQIETILVIGLYAQAYHLDIAGSLTERVRRFRDHWPQLIPLPHPSWRNTGWLKANPWFESELLPPLRLLVRELTG